MELNAIFAFSLKIYNMPHIPIPPTSRKFTQQLINATNAGNIVNIHQPNSNIAQQIKDIAEQQARMVCNEWMKQYKDLFESKITKLTIKNINKLSGYEYDSRLRVIGIKEYDTHYEFTLGNDLINDKEIILLHRRQTDSGHYIMEYNGRTLWATKDEIDMPEKIIICMQTL
jgi:hypothetical protein